MPVHVRPERLLWVKMRNAREEQMFSGVATTTDITRAFDPSRTPPVTDDNLYFTGRRP